MLGGELPAFAPTSHGYNQPFFKYANAQNKIAASEIKRKSEPLSFSFAPEVVLIPRLTVTRQQTRRLSLDHQTTSGLSVYHFYYSTYATGGSKTPFCQLWFFEQQYHRRNKNSVVQIEIKK
ncbi:MAG TPA: hypothetical protein IAC65_05755 [Candidatus Aphodousia faecipullorum]|nr:hypothetical protein [Candidatus Aphodousia faecipullorum]